MGSENEQDDLQIFMNEKKNKLVFVNGKVVTKWNEDQIIL